jgi:hypothetical protein
MVEPIRIQLSRRKGWKMPENTVKVDRTTRWGNSWKVGSNMLDPATRHFRKCETVEDTIAAFRQFVDWAPPTYEDPWTTTGGTEDEPTTLVMWGGYDDRIHVNRSSIRRYLSGKNLACWCALDTPCHADVLLEIASEPTP